MEYKAKDIAKLLGISSATVSLVINNRPGVSEETRLQVLAKISELGSQDLLKKKSHASRNIGFVVYKCHGIFISQSPFFALLIESIETHARKNECRVIIVHIDRSNPIDEQLEYIRSLDCSGLIIFATEMLSEDLVPLKQINIPMVILDNYFVTDPMDAVAINNEQGTFEAVKHLVNLGHKQIGYLQSKVYLTSLNERKYYFFAALRKFGITGMEKFVFRVGYPEENTYADFHKILDSGVEMPTALFADNDIIAYGAIKALKEKGYKIPDDISVIGFDDRPICMMIDPPITTINVPKSVFGKFAVDTLINKIDNKLEGSVKIEIGTNLVLRSSTGKPKER
jgi:LacI family transcriptional regulator